MCGCEKNIKTFENGGNIDEKDVVLYDIVDLDGTIVEKDLTEEALINWANTYEWYDLMDVSEDFPIGQIDNVEDAIIAIQGLDNEGDYTVVKKDLVDSKFENGGVIESFRRFTEGDFNRLTYDDFEGRWSGFVWEIKHNNSSKTLGKFNPKKNTLFILGKKDLTNPLVKWLQQNSFVSSDEYHKLENGGGIGKSKLYVDNKEPMFSKGDVIYVKLHGALKKGQIYREAKTEKLKIGNDFGYKHTYPIELDNGDFLGINEIELLNEKGEFYQYKMGGKISKNKNWIANALSGGKNKGALRRTAMRKGLLRNEDEKLSMTDLHKLEKVGGKTSKRAYLAETLRKFDNGGEIKEFSPRDNYINLKYIENGKELGHLNYEYDKDGVFSLGLDDYPYNFKNELYIDYIDVDKDNRNKGIAKKLLKRAIEDAKKLGINVVTLKRDSGLGCNYGSDYDNYLKSLYSSVGFFETWTQRDSDESGGEKNICGMHLNIINERWGNDGSTASNNNDYNRLYALFPDNHEQAKYIWNQLTDKQKSGFINDLEVTDAASEHIAESWLEFINSSSQDDYWENATNWDEMKNGGEVGGRGWGKFKKGEKISSLKDVKVGELYLDHSNQFNSNNIILITSGDTTGLNRDIVYASFVRPNNLKGREETFAIWGHDLEGKIDLYKIKGRKYEFGGNVDLEVYPDEDLRYTNRKIKKSKETLVRENIYNGEIQEYILKTIIGKTPEYPYQIVGSLKLTKCFLRPYYKI